MTKEEIDTQEKFIDFVKSFYFDPIEDFNVKYPWYWETYQSISACLFEIVSGIPK